MNWNFKSQKNNISIFIYEPKCTLSIMNDKCPYTLIKSEQTFVKSSLFFFFFFFLSYITFRFMVLCTSCYAVSRGVDPGGQGGRPPPHENIGGGANISFCPPIILTT